MPFFEASNWHAAVMTSGGWMIILTLAVLECLLSVDNAVVLAAQTKSLPTEKLQHHALVYGMWGAYLFRFIAIGLGAYLLHFWGVKAAGALYLLWMSGHYFYGQRHPSSGAKPEVREKHVHFWRTVLQIEALDVVFSVDSILAALAVDSNPVIVLIGGCLGILAMRFVAQVITNFITKVPELETMAYVLIGVIAFKLAGSLPMINVEIPNWLFSLIVVAAFGVTWLVHQRHVKKRREA
ncbi:TerC family protein [Lacticaseibacillus absianus]|uniref:TerC family protein n=1 Tax=Lacticaseibacillus absianus TaxID=2729623 RepID=UPI001FEBA9C5|nr:TerC family protein [Lacticaseibacillus absianus]